MQVDDGDIFEVYITLCVENARYNSQAGHDQGLKSITIFVKATKFLGGYHCNGGAD
jgi:hypothetical protein